MTRHRKKREKKEPRDWRTTLTLFCLLGLISYTTYYAWGETNDILAEKETIARMAVYLDQAKIGQYLPRWLPADLADINKEQTVLEIRIYEARERVMSRWCFMLIDRRGKILAIMGHRLRLSRQ